MTTMRRRSIGFTLIELMVTVAILSIVLGLGLPSMRDFVVANRLTSDVNSLIGFINYARSEAITRNQSVVICPKSNTTNACVNSQFWNEYAIQMFIDEDGSGNRNTGDTLLKTLPAIDTTGTQTAVTQPSATAAKKIIFGSIGFSQSPVRLDVHTVKPSDAAYEFKYGRSICISKPGRARVVAYSSATCSSF
jgi:type IV fimbrial biogenesis protein FimT